MRRARACRAAHGEGPLEHHGLVSAANLLHDAPACARRWGSDSPPPAGSRARTRVRPVRGYSSSTWIECCCGTGFAPATRRAFPAPGFHARRPRPGVGHRGAHARARDQGTSECLPAPRFASLRGTLGDGAGRFTCPYHAWSYDLGRLLVAREMPDGFDRNDFGLRSLPVRVAEGLIFTTFAAAPLYFAPAALALAKSAGVHGWGNAERDFTHKDSGSRLELCRILQSRTCPKRSRVPNIVEIEHEALAFWEREEVFSKLRSQIAGNSPWSFLDGPSPPTTQWASIMLGAER